MSKDRVYTIEDFNYRETVERHKSISESFYGKSIGDVFRVCSMPLSLRNDRISRRVDFFIDWSEGDSDREVVCKFEYNNINYIERFKTRFHDVLSSIEIENLFKHLIMLDSFVDLSVVDLSDRAIEVKYYYKYSNQADKEYTDKFEMVYNFHTTNHLEYAKQVISALCSLRYKILIMEKNIE